MIRLDTVHQLATNYVAKNYRDPIERRRKDDRPQYHEIDAHGPNGQELNHPGTDEYTAVRPSPAQKPKDHLSQMVDSARALSDWADNQMRRGK